MAEFIRDAAAEARAIARGTTTAAEIERRGGINKSGYYGDSFNPEVNLSDEEYAAARAKGGGGAINAATQARQKAVSSAQLKAKFMADGLSEADAQKKIDQLYANLEAGQSVDANGNVITTSATTSTITTPASPTDTGPTLASDVFKQTLAVFFGPTEMAKPWANELYKAVSKFYKAGATSEEAFNMAVLDSENNPALADFTKRFKGIYALQKMKQAGKAVTVPTIAEYFATESKMGDVLKQSNLGDLANEDFLGDVLSKGVSATEFANRITAIFDRIDNSPKEIKDTLSRYFPTVDRISLAKAIALGDRGAKELQAQVAGYEVLSAAEKQGLSAGQLVGGTTEERAYQYALGGETYDTALTKFGTVAAMLPSVNKLTQIYGEETLGQTGVESAIFGKSAKEIKRLEDLAKKEEASFSGRSGVSQISLASQRRGAGII